MDPWTCVPKGPGFTTNVTEEQEEEEEDKLGFNWIYLIAVTTKTIYGFTQYLLLPMISFKEIVESQNL